MVSFKAVERVPYTAEQMFDLVASVETYEEFLPLCERSVVIERRTIDDTHEELFTILELRHKKTGVRDTFESTVHLDRDLMQIETIADSGPVKHLKSRWSFEDVADGGSEARFTVEYQMRGTMLQMLVGKLYQILFERIASAFKERARVVYG